MSFDASPKVQLYGTLFENFLDQIPIRDPKDVQTLIQALESLSSPRSNVLHFRPKLMLRIGKIKTESWNRHRAD